MSTARMYWKSCRICGSCEGVYTDLMEKSNEPYLHQINKLLPINIHLKDNLPKSICHNCIAVLAEFDFLTAKCKLVEEKLLSTAEKMLTNEQVVSGSVTDSANIPKETQNPASQSPDSLKVHLKRVESSDIKKILESSVSETPAVSTNEQKKIDKTETTSLDKFIVTRIPESDVVLYNCKVCSAILISKEGASTHECPVGSSKRKNSLDSDKSTSSDPDSDDENESKKEVIIRPKRRKRILTMH